MSLETIYWENLEKLCANYIFCTDIAFIFKNQSTFTSQM